MRIEKREIAPKIAIIAVLTDASRWLSIIQMRWIQRDMRKIPNMAKRRSRTSTTSSKIFH
jgi:hypothetical protein